MRGIYILILLLASSTIITQAQQPQQSNTRASGSGNKKVCVAGEVAKPLEIYFNDRLTLTQALKEAGGILPRNKDYEVLVISEMIGGGTRIIHVDLKAIEKKAYKDFGLQDFDLVGVLPKRMEKRVLQPLKNSCPSWPAGIKF